MVVAKRKGNSNKTKSNVDQHKIWLIAGISVAVLLVLAVIIFPVLKGPAAGQATDGGPEFFDDVSITDIAEEGIVTLYKENVFSNGDQLSFDCDAPNLHYKLKNSIIISSMPDNYLVDIGDDVEGLEVKEGYAVKLYEDAYFKGRHLTLAGKTTQTEMHNKVSSVEIEEGCSVELYSKNDYEGNIIDGVKYPEITLAGDSPNLAANNKIKSIKIIGDNCKLELREKKNFKGEKTFLTSSSGSSIMDSISSIIVEGDGCSAKLYSEEGFLTSSFLAHITGNSAELDADDSADSTIVTPGCTAKLWQHKDYDGSLMTVAGRSPYLSSNSGGSGGSHSFSSVSVHMLNDVNNDETGPGYLCPAVGYHFANMKGKPFKILEGYYKDVTLNEDLDVGDGGSLYNQIKSESKRHFSSMMVSPGYVVELNGQNNMGYITLGAGYSSQLAFGGINKGYYKLIGRPCKTEFFLSDVFVGSSFPYNFGNAESYSDSENHFFDGFKGLGMDNELYYGFESIKISGFGDKWPTGYQCRFQIDGTKFDNNPDAVNLPHVTLAYGGHKQLYDYHNGVFYVGVKSIDSIKQAAIEATQEQNCHNFVDDDGDGKVDCQDPNCKGKPGLNAVGIVKYCSDPFGSEKNCNDNWDNDGDGLVDCEDSNCFDNVQDCGNEFVEYSFDGDAYNNKGVKAVASGIGPSSYPSDGVYKAVELEGTTTDYVKFPAEHLDGLTDFTVMLWVKPESTGGGKDGILSAANSEQDNELIIFNPKDLSFFIKGVEKKTSAMLNPVDDAGMLGWNHIAITRKVSGSSSSLMVYYGGNFKGQLTGFPGGALNVESLILGQEQDLDKAGTAQVSVGGGFWIAAGQAYKGRVDEVKFYKRVLSEDEIKAIVIGGTIGGIPIWGEAPIIGLQAISKEYDCDNGLDDESDGYGDGLIDCADPDCANDDACKIPDEVCTDTIDNDQDGKVSCADSDCLGQWCAGSLGSIKSCVNSPLGGTPGLNFCCPANTCAYSNACYDHGTPASFFGSADKILCVDEDNAWVTCNAFNKDVVIGEKECNGVKWIPYVPLSLADGEACLDDDDCESGNCINDVCVSDEEPEPEEPTLLANGEACTEDAQCESGSCPSVSRGQNKVCVGPALVDPECTTHANCEALYPTECVGTDKVTYSCVSDACQPSTSANDPDCVEPVSECTTNADCRTLYADQIECVGTTKKTFICSTDQECKAFNSLQDSDCVEATCPSDDWANVCCQLNDIQFSNFIVAQLNEETPHNDIEFSNFIVAQLNEEALCE